LIRKEVLGRGLRQVIVISAPPGLLATLAVLETGDVGVGQDCSEVGAFPVRLLSPPQRGSLTIFICGEKQVKEGGGTLSFPAATHAFLHARASVPTAAATSCSRLGLKLAAKDML